MLPSPPEPPFVSSSIDPHGVAEVVFFHPKGNAMPSQSLWLLAAQFDRLAADAQARVIVLKSLGEGAFCAGAYFDELLSIEDERGGKAFFMSFVRALNAMRRCPKIIMARVQGKAVGGGLGLACAADYAAGAASASLRLSEINVGIGPLVISPFVERKVGKARYMQMTLEAGWFSAQWGMDHGVFARIFSTIAELDAHLYSLAKTLATKNPEALAAIKAASWEDTQHFDQLLERRATASGRLVLSEFTRSFIQSFRR